MKLPIVDTFDCAKLRALARSKKRRSVSTLSIPRPLVRLRSPFPRTIPSEVEGLGRGVERVDKPLIILLISAMAVRVFYAQLRPVMAVYPDSYGYYSLGNEMLSQPSPQTIVNPFRTPAYPLFVAGVMKLGGTFGAPIDTPRFHQGAALVMLAQTMLGLTGLIFFYLTIRLAGLPAWASMALGIFTAFNIRLFSWERTLTSEALAIPWMLAATYLFLVTLKRPTPVSLGLLWVLYLIGFLIRPAFLLLPVTMLPILVFYHRRREISLWGLIFLSTFLLVPWGYAKLNQRYHHYRGIQQVAEIDLMGRILQFKLSVESGKQFTFFYQAVSDHRKKSDDATPFRFLENYDANIYTNAERMNELAAFVRAVIIHNLPAYLGYSLADIPKVFLQTSDFFTNIKLSSGNVLAGVFYQLTRVYNFTKPLTIIAVLLYLITLVKFWRRPSYPTAVQLAVGTIAATYIALTVLVVYSFSYGELDRFTNVVEPQLYLFLLLWVASILGWWSRAVSRSRPSG